MAKSHHVLSREDRTYVALKWLMLASFVGSIVYLWLVRDVELGRAIRPLFLLWGAGTCFAVARFRMRLDVSQRIVSERYVRPVPTDAVEIEAHREAEEFFRSLRGQIA